MYCGQVKQTEAATKDPNNNVLMSSKTATSQLAFVKVGFACVLVIFVCVFTLCLFPLGDLFVVLFCLLLVF